MRSDKGARLGHAQEEADCHDTLGAMHGSRDHGQTAPDQHHRREVEVRAKIGNCQVRWNLANNVSSEVLEIRYDLGNPDSYPTVKTVLMTLSCFPWNLRSSFMPDTYALLRLLRSK